MLLRKWERRGKEEVGGGGGGGGASASGVGAWVDGGEEEEEERDIDPTLERGGGENVASISSCNSSRGQSCHAANFFLQQRKSLHFLNDFNFFFQTP